MISLNHAAIHGLIAAGQPLPKPIWTTAIIDTGSSLSCVTSDVLQKLGIAAVMQTTTQTAKGSASVYLFEISLSIPPAGNVPGTMLTRSDLLVMELIDPIPGIEVLIGLDILLDCRLLLDGPARRFTLDF